VSVLDPNELESVDGGDHVELHPGALDPVLDPIPAFNRRLSRDGTPELVPIPLKLQAASLFPGRQAFLEDPGTGGW
jgi:hypothetical protein